MKNYISYFLENISEEFLKKHNKVICETERPQTTKDNHKACDYMYSLLLENGIEAERLNFVSDGRTAYLDNITPLCWDASYGRLTVLSEWEGDRVVADYEKEPFNLIRCSVATPEGGLTTELVTWDDMMNGKDVKGCIVLLPTHLQPDETALVPCLDKGAVGVVNGTVWNCKDPENSVHWCNNLTETNAWHVNENERDFVGFSVSPDMHRKLRKACEKGKVTVKAETDARRYAGEMPAVTAVIRGESPREFWIYAHCAEPLEDDNNAGCTLNIALIIAIKKAIEKGIIPPLKYTLRIMMSLERYGTVAFAHKYGDTLHNHCIGGLCVDGLPLSHEHQTTLVRFANHAVPFYGNCLWEWAFDEFGRSIKDSPFVVGQDDYFGGDTFLSDSSVGLPTVTILGHQKITWHNSRQRESYVEYGKLHRLTAVLTAFAATVCCCDKEKLEAFLPMAASYAISRLARYASQTPPRDGTDEKARFDHLKGIELRNIRAFADAGVSADKIAESCSMVHQFCNRITPVASKEGKVSPMLEKFASVIPKRLTVGIPHDLARIPLQRRLHTLQTFLLSRVFSAMDGKKTLKELVTEAEWDQKSAWSEEELEYFKTTVDLLCEFGYIGLK